MNNEIGLLILEAIIVVISICMSAFFSGSEVALTSISVGKIKKITGKFGEHHLLNEWLLNPSKYLSTILVGNNIVNIGGTLIAGDFFHRLTLLLLPEQSDGAIPGVTAFVVMTFLVLEFGEILPKIYCRHNHDRIAPRVIFWVDLIYRLLKLPITIVMQIATLVIRLFGGHTNREVSLITPDELRVLIDVSEKQGELEEGEKEMLHSIFKLSETSVREIMVPRVDVQFLQLQDDLTTVLSTFEEHGFSRLPVIDGTSDNIVGILYVKDLLHHWRTVEINPNLITEIMRPCVYIPETKRIDDLLKQFQQEKTHIAIVVDEYGGTAGLVTIEDILEEIVGEIQDEFDEEEESIIQVASETWEVDASTDLEDMADELEIDMSEDAVEFDSLAGYLLESRGDLPKPGEVIELDNMRFTILEADEKRILKVRVEKLHPEEVGKNDTTTTDPQSESPRK